MDFHQSATELFAQRILERVCNTFDGKVINSDECNIDLMLKSIPDNINDNILQDSIPKSPKQIVNKVSVSDDADPIFKDNIKTKKVKKDKTPKKSQEDQPSPEEPKPKKKRPENAYFRFKRDPANAQAIADYIAENGITDKRKAQKGVWDSLSQEEKDTWKMKAIEEFNAQSD